MGKKRLLGWTLVIAAAATVALLAPEKPREVSAPQRAGSPAVFPKAPMLQQQAAPSDPLAALPSRDMVGRPSADPFAARSSQPPPPKKSAKAPAVVEVAPEPPPAPQPPPMPYRVAGRVVQQGVPHIVLAKGDRVYPVRTGDLLEDGYRVEAIDARSVTLVYTPLGIPQQLAVTQGLELQPSAVVAVVPPSGIQGKPLVAEQGAAKLRWEGPARIRAGDPFHVSLKVTSAEAVRSAPLQVSFDAEQLEAVDVRRGGFFADGSFSYRISPSGSIFIGATGKGAVAADAEFFVVTFKPVRAGVTTELKLSSVLLQGAAGRAIAHDQPVAFRAAIVQ